MQQLEQENTLAMFSGLILTGGWLGQRYVYSQDVRSNVETFAESGNPNCSIPDLPTCKPLNRQLPKKCSESLGRTHKQPNYSLDLFRKTSSYNIGVQERHPSCLRGYVHRKHLHFVEQSLARQRVGVFGNPEVSFCDVFIFLRLLSLGGASLLYQIPFVAQ